MAKIKTIKGFDSELKCRGFQYKVGKTYKLSNDEQVKLCLTGFHAIKDDVSPLTVFDYYPPSINGKPSRYCEVEVSGDIKTDLNKIVGSEIKICREISISDIIKSHEEWVKRMTDDDENRSSNISKFSIASNTGHSSTASNKGNYSIASNTGDRSTASNTGSDSVASNTGDYSTASNTGYYSIASNTGYYSIASNTGNHSAASNTGHSSTASNTGSGSVASNKGVYSTASNTGGYSVASNTGKYSTALNSGDRSTASNTGYGSVALNTGDGSVASNTGDRSTALNTGNGSVASNTSDRSIALSTGFSSKSEVHGSGSIAAAFGENGIARGSMGCALVLVERNIKNDIINIKAVMVDGLTVKADTWYKLVEGELVEVV